MRRDIKINYEVITDTINELQKYEDSLDTMKRCIRSMKSNLQQSEAESVTALLENFSTSEENINTCQKEIKDIKSILSDYIQAMSEYATPLVHGAMTQIDRNDVWWNLGSIEKFDTDLRGALYYGSSYCGSYSNDEDVIEDEQYNARQIDEINELGNSLLYKLNAYMDDLWAIYNNKIVPFENTDDEFAQKATDLYWSYTGLGDWISDFFRAFGEGVKDMLAGVLDALVDLVKGLASLAVGVLKYVGSGATVLLSSPFGATPTWAKEYFNSTNDMIGSILKDPLILVEGLAQGVSDALDSEGVFYSVGYVGGSILGAKGLDKVSKVTKGVLTGTKVKITVNSLDDIAKHGLKSIDEIVSKAGITSLSELKRIGVGSIDDLVALGVTSAKDLPRLGIHTMKDLTELGIKSTDDLAKIGIKNVNDFVEARLGSLDDANRAFKEASGSGKLERPSWRQSELDAVKDFPDYSPQKSFKKMPDGTIQEVPYGTKGSVRPDYYKAGHSVDIKNYDITTPSGRSSLKSNITKQYKQRLEALPPGIKQTVVIDVRGQSITDSILDSLYKDIMKSTNSGIEIRFKVTN